MISIAIIADRSSRARALADVLAEDRRFEVVSAGDLASASILTDLGLVDVIVAISLRPDQLPRSAAPVLIVGDQPADQDAFGRSVRGWLPANASPSEISASISAIANDLSVLTPDQAKRWLRSPETGAQQERPIESLTTRETQVLRMLADGLGNKIIAGQLGISEHTAKFHVAQILAKLGAGSRAEAVALGMRRGLVPI